MAHLILAHRLSRYKLHAPAGIAESQTQLLSVHHNEKCCYSIDTLVAYCDGEMNGVTRALNSMQTHSDNAGLRVKQCPRSDHRHV